MGLEVVGLVNQSDVEPNVLLLLFLLELTGGTLNGSNLELVVVVGGIVYYFIGSSFLFSLLTIEVGADVLLFEFGFA